ncbi:juvenile hormone acid O-methyltransferase-like, partial [Musca vetustissima]|uniref:juvenile hormone acid O-methyltransferase-like n=1 Tax=Musca vetustissima TaxID=27455 RepID=UPI002AB6D7B8
QTFRNIYDLLKPEGGDCLLVTLAYHPTFDAYKRMSQTEKWSEYMYDVESFMPQQQYSPDPKGDFMGFLQNAGFSDYQVEVRNKVFPHQSLNVFRNNMVAVNPFIDRLPKEKQSEFVNDFLSCICDILGLNITRVDFNATFPVPYKLAVMYAKKSGNIC